MKEVISMFGKSPVVEVQKHIAICEESTALLLPLVEAANSGDWDKANTIREKICDLEHDADEVKKSYRLSMSKSLFMPVSRSALLELIIAQDKIANIAKDFAQLMCTRSMQIPEQVRSTYAAFVEKNHQAVQQAVASINELDELFATGFRGNEADLVKRMIQTLDEIESETDDLQWKTREELFAIENELPPIDVIFLYRLIALTGEIGDRADNTGRHLELMLAS